MARLSLEGIAKVGDVRFTPLYERLRDAEDPLRVLKSFTDTDVIAALAATPRRDDPYLANVLATEALNRAERLRTATHLMAEGLLMLDAHQTITYANAAAEALLEAPRDTLLGQPFKSFPHVEHVPEDEPCALDDAVREKRAVESDHEILKSASGRAFPVHMSVAPVLLDDVVTGFVVVFHDVTARKREEAAVRDRTELEAAIARVSTRLIAPEDLDAAIDSSLGDLGSLRGVSRAFTYLHTKHGLCEPVHEWCAPGVPSRKREIRALAAHEAAWWRGRLERGEPVLVPDVTMLPQEERAMRAVLESQGARAVLAFPLVVDEDVAGVLAVQHTREPRGWSESDIILLRVLSEVMGRAIEARTRLEDARFMAYALYHASCCVWMLDEAGGFHFVNERAARYYGYTPDAFRDLRIFDVNPEMTRDAWHETWRLVEEHPIITVSTWHQAADGRRFPVDVDATRISFRGRPFLLAIVHDVSRRVRHERHLEWRAETYRVLFRDNPDAVYAFDREGVCTAVNPATARLTGYEEDELTGLPFTRIVAPHHHGHARRLVRAAHRGRFQHGHVTLERKDGSHVDVEITMIPIRVEGRPAGVYGIARPTRGALEE